MTGMDRIKKILIALFALAISILSDGPSTANPYKSTTIRIVDFRLFYPFGFLKKGTTQKPYNHMGIDLKYQYYFDSRWGPVLDGGFWVMPVKKNNDKENLFQVYSLIGIGFRPMSRFYLDPVLNVLGGLSLSDAGQFTNYRIGYPFGTQLSLTLFSSAEPFKDPDMSLNLSGSTYYVIRQNRLMSPVYFDIGLSIKGAF